MTDKKRKKSGQQVLEGRVVCAEKGKHKSGVPECEDTEVHDEKSDQRESLVVPGPFGFSLCKGHLDDVEKTDYHVLGPVKDQYGRNTPSEK